MRMVTGGMSAAWEMLSKHGGFSPGVQKKAVGYG